MNIHELDKKRCISALILCLLVSLIVFYDIIFVLTYMGGTLYFGTEKMRYFTYESNIFMGIVSLLCVPFQIEGLRHKNYHLPRWLVNLLYVAVCTITITFILVITIMLPLYGPNFALFEDYGFIPHIVTPLLSMITFIFINDDHEIHKNVYILAILPIVVYLIAYITNVYVTNNWADHYHLDKIGPLWFTSIGSVFIYFIVAVLLRKIHNKRHFKRKQLVKQYYLTSDEVSYKTIDEAITKLAKENKKYDKGGDVIVPRRIILMMEDKYHSGKSIEELCSIYIKNYN